MTSIFPGSEVENVFEYVQINFSHPHNELIAKYKYHVFSFLAPCEYNCGTHDWN